MRRVAAALAAALGAASASAQSPPPPALDLAALDPIARLVLIGDAGHEDGAEEHLAAISEWIARQGAPSHVIFLGDNFYPRGEWANAQLRRAILDRQRAVGRVPGDVVFIPGNHDWRVNGRSEQNSERLAALAKDAAPAEWRPALGEPGPAVFDAHGFRVIALDSDQWIAERNPERLRQAEQRLRDALACPGCEDAIVVAHHPLESAGPHGECAGALRRLARFDQDLHSTPYARYVRALEPILRDHPPLLFAAGHDHSLQVARGAWGETHVVSGAGAELTPVCAKDAPLSWSVNGFIAVERAAGGAIQLRVFRFGDEAECGALRFCEIHRQPLSERRAP